MTTTSLVMHEHSPGSVTGTRLLFGLLLLAVDGGDLTAA